MPFTPELPPRIWPAMTAIVRLFKPVCGAEVMLKVRVGSIKPQNPPDTVVTELEFSTGY